MSVKSGDKQSVSLHPLVLTMEQSREMTLFDITDYIYDNKDEEEDPERDDDHLLPLPSFDSNHLCHHLLQALLLRGGLERKPDHHASDDHHLHQQDGELAPHL